MKAKSLHLRLLAGAALACLISGSAYADGGPAADKPETVKSPDVTMDRLLNADTISVSRQLRAQTPTVQVLLYGLDRDPTVLAPALHAGVRGFADRATDLHQLVDALRRLATGGLAVSPGLVDAVTLSYAALLAEHPADDLPSVGELSPREREALLLIRAGCSNRQVGARLALSEHTVRAHLRSAFRKLGATNRVHAVQLLLDRDGADVQPAASASASGVLDKSKPRRTTAVPSRSPAPADAASAELSRVTRLLLVSDYTLLAQGLAALLQDRLETTVRVTRLSEDLPAIVHEWRPDMVLVETADVRNTVGRWLPLHQAYPWAPLVVIAPADSDQVKEALLAGARGFVPRDASPSQLFS